MDLDLTKVDYDVDVLVIGGGGAGASAAIEAIMAKPLAEIKELYNNRDIEK